MIHGILKNTYDYSCMCKKANHFYCLSFRNGFEAGKFLIISKKLFTTFFHINFLTLRLVRRKMKLEKQSKKKKGKKGKKGKKKK